MRQIALVPTLALLFAIASSANAFAATQACLKQQLAVGKLTRDVSLLEGKVSRAEQSLMTRQERGETQLASLSNVVTNARAAATAAAANAAGRGVSCAFRGGQCIGGAASQAIAQLARARAQVTAAQKRYDAYARAYQKQIERLANNFAQQRDKLSQKQTQLDSAQQALSQCADAQPA